MNNNVGVQCEMKLFIDREHVGSFPHFLCVGRGVVLLTFVSVFVLFLLLNNKNNKKGLNLLCGHKSKA